MAGLINLKLLTDFFNKIGQERQICVDRAMSAVPPLATKMLSRSKRAPCGDPRSSQRRCCPAALVHRQISLSRRRLLHRGFDAGR
jgi:hypothetical protein